jgi:hypothetical protein
MKSKAGTWNPCVPALFFFLNYFDFFFMFLFTKIFYIFFMCVHLFFIIILSVKII